jgi:hypothetical protein
VTRVSARPPRCRALRGRRNYIRPECVWSKRKTVVTVKNLLLLTLVSSAAFAANTIPASPEYPAVCGPYAEKFNVKPVPQQSSVGQPEPGKALVYFIEEDITPPLGTSPLTVRLGENGAWIGATRGTSHLAFSLDPGEHHFCADWQSATPRYYRRPSLTNLRVEVGHTYYLRARLTDILRLFTLDLDPVNPDEGAYLVGISPLSTYAPKK